MNSKKPEEVRKRRAKPDMGSGNVYQKMVLVAGVLTLFLAIGLSPMMAPILAAGIVGGTLLLFFLVRRIRPKGKESKGIEPVEPPRPVEEISPGHRDILLTEEEEGSFDSPEIPPEEKEPAELRAISLEEREEGTPKEAVKDQESVPGEKAPRKDRQEFPAKPFSPYVIFESQGEGHYVGTVFSIQCSYGSWFGESDDRFYVDGETEPSIVGTGCEDFFNDAWNLRLFTNPNTGVTIKEPNGEDCRFTAYRWHIQAPVTFRKSLKVEIERRSFAAVTNPETFTPKFCATDRALRKTSGS